MQFPNILAIGLALAISVTGSPTPDSETELEKRAWGQVCNADVYPGICEPTATCAGYGGWSNSANLCPGGEDIQCCQGIPCHNGMDTCYTDTMCLNNGGIVDWSPACPGPANFVCCTWPWLSD